MPTWDISSYSKRLPWSCGGRVISTRVSGLSASVVIGRNIPNQNCYQVQVCLVLRRMMSEAVGFSLVCNFPQLLIVKQLW